MTIVETVNTIKEGHWNETIKSLLGKLKADTAESHKSANSSIRYSLKRLDEMTKTQPDGTIFFHAVDALDFASRAVGIARAMAALGADESLDVCDVDLFDEIADVCMSMTGIARSAI